VKRRIFKETFFFFRDANCKFFNAGRVRGKRADFSPDHKGICF
jgi:hypothetical protein